MATLKDLLDSGMSRDEINALLSQSYVGTDGFQQAGYEQGPPVAQEYPPSDMLPPPQYRGESMASQPMRQFIQQPVPQSGTMTQQDADDARAYAKHVMETGGVDAQGRPTSTYTSPQQFRSQKQLPQNYIQNERTGRVIDMGQSQPAGPAMDYSMPIEIGGYGKGYRLKGDATRAVLANGQIVSMGRDTGAERARMKEDLGLDKIRAEIANMNKPYESAEDKALARETAKTKGEADRAKQAAGIPGTPEYKKIQAENSAISQAKTTKENFDRHADAYIKNIDMLIGDSETNKEHVGLRGAVGSIDAALPDWLSTQNQVDARRLGEGLLNKASVAGLKDIRSEGTAPGSITEKEWPIFQTQGEIMSMSQSKDQYKKALIDKREEIIQSKERVARNYEERVGKYGVQPASGSAAPDKPAQPAGEKVMSMQDVMDTARSRNKTTDQVMKDARAAGFTIK